MNSFPLATVLNCHKFSGLKQYRLTILQFQETPSLKWVYGDVHFYFLRIYRRTCLFELFQFLGAACLPWLMAPSLHPQSLSHLCPSDFFPPLIRTFNIIIQITSISGDLLIYLQTNFLLLFKSLFQYKVAFSLCVGSGFRTWTLLRGN